MPTIPTRARVLVVDDEAVNRLLVRTWLEREHEVLVATDGAEALEAIARFAPDLVLLDILMPGLNGYEVCREIKRRQGDGPLLPVLLLTALEEREHVRAGLEAGADDFLTKPCDPVELRLRVRAFLRTRRQDMQICAQLSELQRISALKDDLVALVAHDLRSPLGTVLSLLRIARENPNDPELPTDLDVALRAAEQVRDIAEDLLQVRLLEHCDVTPVRAPLSAEEVIRSAIEPLRPQAAERHVSLELSVEGAPRFDLDARLTVRAVQNLVANALKYGPAGGRIDVAVRREGPSLLVEVADRGPGIPETLRSAGFHELCETERLDDPRRGYGLGLRLVQLVARAHGGEASAHDRPGGGALLRLRLEPAAAFDAAAPPPLRAASEVHASP
jgi:signal transduction histidine kinase